MLNEKQDNIVRITLTETESKGFGKIDTAVIEFVNGEFEKCEYSLKGRYTLSDWLFLGNVSKRIKELHDEFHCKKGE